MRKISIGFFFVLGVCLFQGQAQVDMSDPLIRAVFETYDEILAKNPEDYMTYYRRAMDYYAYGDTDRALADMERAMGCLPKREKSIARQKENIVLLYLLRAELYERKQEYSRAEADWNKACSLQPDSPAALAGRASSYMRNGCWDDAAADYRSILRIDPRSRTAYFGLARIAAEQGRNEEATDLLNTAVAFTPARPDVYMERADIYRRMGMLREEIADLVAVLTMDDANREAAQRLIVYGDTDFDTVVKEIGAAIRRHSGADMLYYIRAVVSKNNRKYAQALSDLKIILGNRKFYTSSLFYDRAYCYFHRGLFAEALEDMDMAMRLAEVTPDMGALQIRILRALGRDDEAIRVVNRFLKRYVSSDDLYLLRALLAHDKGDWQTALQSVRKAIVLNAGNLQARLLSAEWSDDEECARREYEQLAEQAACSKLPDASWYRCAALSALDASDELTEALEIWSREEKENARIGYGLACLYAAAGDEAEALACLDRALSAGYDDAYRLNSYSDSKYSLRSLRSLPEFEELKTRYPSSF